MDSSWKEVETAEIITALGLIGFGLYITFGLSEFTFYVWYNFLWEIAERSTWGLGMALIGATYFTSLLCFSFRWFGPHTALLCRIGSNLLCIAAWGFIVLLLVGRRGEDLVLYQFAVIMIGVYMVATCLNACLGYIRAMRAK